MAAANKNRSKPSETDRFFQNLILSALEEKAGRCQVFGVRFLRKSFAASPHFCPNPRPLLSGGKPAPPQKPRPAVPLGEAGKGS
jgi:hypothetical protein